jgi:MFS family permease
MVSLGPAYRRWWSASALSSIGAGMYDAALPLLAAALTSEPALVAGVAVALELPWLVFGLFAGAIVDRVDTRRLVAAVNVVSCLLVGGLATAVAFDRAGLPLVYVVALACGTGATLTGTATSTMVPRLVATSQLDLANGRLITATSAGAEMLGPPAGGYLFGLAAALPFAVHSSTAAIAAALVFGLPRMFAPAPPAVRPRILRDVVAGARWLVRHKTLRAVTGLSVVFALTDSAWFAIMVLYVTEVLELPSAAYGLLVGIGGIGGLAGGLAAARLARTIRPVGRLLVSLLLGAGVAQAVLGLSADPIVTTVALSVSSFAFGVWNVVSVTLRQTLAPADHLGRVTSADRTAIMGASPLGALLGGLAAGAFGIRAPFLLGLPILLVGALLGYRALRRAPADLTRSPVE